MPLKATEYESGNLHEQYSGESQRRRIAASGAGWGAASATTGLASAGLAAHRFGGRKDSQVGLKALAAKHPAYKEPINSFARRSLKVAAKPKTALAATAGLAATGAATGAVSRFRRNEEAGISQGIGRIKAGAQYRTDQQRIAKSVMSNLGMAGSLMQDPASKKALAHVIEHRKIYGAGAGVLAATGGTVEGARRGRLRATETRKTKDALVTKGGREFALVGALTGGGGLAAAAGSRGSKRHPDESRELAGATVGGWAGQGAYQGSGYAAKWRAQAKKEPLTTRSQRDKALKPVKREHGAYTAAMERNYPKSLPEARTHRVLGWTHRGKTGTVLGGATTVAGTYAGARLMTRKQKVNKAFGYEQKRVSPLRATEAAVGITLLGWGGSRLGLVKGTLAAGSRKAGNTGINFARAEKARAAIEASTGRGAAMIGRHSNSGFRLRPIEGAVGGAVLANHAMPVRRKEFTPVRGPMMQGGY